MCISTIKTREEKYTRIKLSRKRFLKSFWAANKTPRVAFTSGAGRSCLQKVYFRALQSYLYGWI